MKKVTKVEESDKFVISLKQQKISRVENILDSIKRYGGSGDLDKMESSQR